MKNQRRINHSNTSKKQGAQVPKSHSGEKGADGTASLNLFDTTCEDPEVETAAFDLDTEELLDAAGLLEKTVARLRLKAFMKGGHVAISLAEILAPAGQHLNN
jgi:hypothetical protein